MPNIKLYNKISQIGLDVFNENYNVSEDVNNAEGILVRSAALHEVEFDKELLRFNLSNFIEHIEWKIDLKLLHQC